MGGRGGGGGGGGGGGFDKLTSHPRGVGLAKVTSEYEDRSSWWATLCTALQQPALYHENYYDFIY